MKDDVDKWPPKARLKELQRKREADEISEEEYKRTSMASAVPEQEIQRSQNAFQDSMRSIADAEKKYVRPVSQTQKQPASLTAREIRHGRWVQRGLEIDKVQREMIRELVVQLGPSCALAILVSISAVVLGIAWILIESTPLWMGIATGVFFLINLVWKFQLSGDSVSYTKFDRFCDAGDNTLWFVIGLGLLWALSTYTPGWVWIIMGLTVVLVLVWDLLLFAVRSLGRAWRNE